jgi:hypothetical protein
VEEVGGEEEGSGGCSDARRGGGDVTPEEPTTEDVDEDDGDRPGQRRGHPPAERLVAEERDTGADEPLPERRMGAAGEPGDVAYRLAAVDVPARVAGVEDLVEDELDRPAEAREPEGGSAERDERQEDRVEPGPGARRPSGGDIDDANPRGDRRWVV